MDVMPDLNGFGLSIETSFVLETVTGFGSFTVEEAASFWRRSKRSTRALVGGIEVVSVGLSLKSGSSVLELPDAFRGFAAIAGFAPGTGFVPGAGGARDAARTAACCEGDLLCDLALC
jgi:hypothetical protein